MRKRVINGQQRPRVAGAQYSGRDPALHPRRQVEEPDRVRDVRPGAANPVSELLVRGLEVIEQLLIGRRLFQGIELLAVQVLYQGIPEQVRVSSLPDDGSASAALPSRSRTDPWLSCGQPRAGGGQRP